MVWRGDRENGSVMTPCSDRLTLSTSAAWRSTVIFLWMTPMPPSRAMAMAMRASVTVSMPALTRGMFRRMSLVKTVDTSTSLGRTSDLPGTSKTSSNVSPTSPILSSQDTARPPRLSESLTLSIS